MSSRKIRRKKKRIKPIWKLLFICIIVAVIVIKFRTDNQEKTSEIITQTISSSGVEVAEKSLLSESAIAGQTIVENEDGYTATFTADNGKNQKTYKEYKQNGTSSWSQRAYWGGTMEENGCGITSLSIIASGYGLDITPEDLRQKYYPHLDGDKIPQVLKSLGIRSTEFCFYDKYISRSYIRTWLKTNRPVLICVDNKKDNVWTKASHYMVLLATNDDGMIYVSNPNGLDKEENASGWYDASEIIPHIVKALFVETY